MIIQRVARVKRKINNWDGKILDGFQMLTRMAGFQSFQQFLPACLAAYNA
jgi:hypothetical protein